MDSTSVVHVAGCLHQGSRERRSAPRQTGTGGTAKAKSRQRPQRCSESRQERRVAGCSSRWKKHKLNEDQRCQQDAASFEKWLKSIPTRAAKAACKPKFDHPLRKGSNGSLMYQCAECPNERTMPKFRTTPCRKRSRGMQVSDWQLLALKKSPALEKKRSGKNRKHDAAYRERLRGTEAGKKRKEAKAASAKAIYQALSKRDRKRLLARDLAQRKKTAKKRMRQEAAKKKQKV